MKIYILRHGATEWNIDRRIQGQTDIPLSSTGKAMAINTGKGMSNSSLKFEMVFSSPLKRAFETAHLVLGELKEQPEIIIDDRLKELNFGFMEGGIVEEMTADISSPFRYFKSHPDLYEKELEKIKSETTEKNMPELLSDMCIRAKCFLQEAVEPVILSEKHPKNSNILISTHGALSRALLMYLCNEKNLANFWGNGLIPNCGAAVIEAIPQNGNVNYTLVKNDVIFNP